MRLVFLLLLLWCLASCASIPPCDHGDLLWQQGAMVKTCPCAQDGTNYVMAAQQLWCW